MENTINIQITACIAAHYDDNYRLSLKNCIKQEKENET